MRHILLSGATGHLGCHLLYEILKHSYDKCYIPVRAKSNMLAYQRVKELFDYYFAINLDIYQERLDIFSADLLLDNIGVNAEYYNYLSSKIDLFFHAAALIKHYGTYDDFYLANIKVTSNLLKLCALTLKKEFHFISTVSVVQDGYIPGATHYEFNEDNDASSLVMRKNLYVISKYEAEQLVIRARGSGINSNIYRIANIVINAENGTIPKTIQENAFFIRMRTYSILKMIPKEIDEIEISPVNETANAIIKLGFSAVKNQIFHVYNSKRYPINDLLFGGSIELVSMGKFIDTVSSSINAGKHRAYLELFILHQGWFNLPMQKYHTMLSINNNFTEKLLKSLSFDWSKLNPQSLGQMINLLH